MFQASKEPLGHIEKVVEICYIGNVIAISNTLVEKADETQTSQHGSKE